MHPLTLNARLVQRDAKTPDGWTHDAWTCSIHHPERAAPLWEGPFKTGPGLRPKCPALLDVIQSLILDADAGSALFVDFCADTGHEIDSRKSLHVYLDCQDAALAIRRIRAAVGPEPWAEIETAAREH